MLYVTYRPDEKEWGAKLGKLKFGVGCLYIKTLEDIDRELLKKMARASIASCASDTGKRRSVRK